MKPHPSHFLLTLHMVPFSILKKDFLVFLNVCFFSQSYVLVYLLFFLSSLSWGIATRTDDMLMTPKCISPSWLVWTVDRLIQFPVLYLLLVLSKAQTFKIFKQKQILDIPISLIWDHCLIVKAEDLSAIFDVSFSYSQIQSLPISQFHLLRISKCNPFFSISTSIILIMWLFSLS